MRTAQIIAETASEIIQKLGAWASQKAVKAAAKGCGLPQAATLAEYQRQAGIRKSRRQASYVATPPIATRLQARLMEQAEKACTRRDQGAANLSPKDGCIIDRDIPARAWLVKATDQPYRGRHTNRTVEAVWLAGYDDGHIFCVRVPSTLSTVAVAVAWLKPAAVAKAEAAGKGVVRQGDIWFVESRTNDFSELRGTRHSAEPQPEHGMVLVTHPEHGSLALTSPMRAYVGKRITSGTARRAYD